MFIIEYMKDDKKNPKHDHRKNISYIKKQYKTYL